MALVGSSGVGKSSMVNALAGLAPDQLQQTGSIREHDAQGRHTTTSRSLHAMSSGGWIIDTPGMRRCMSVTPPAGIDELFAEIIELAPLCRFRDCTHAHEPRCAVSTAVSGGTLNPDRVARWRMIVEENRSNTPELKKPGGSRPTVLRHSKSHLEDD